MGLDRTWIARLGTAAALAAPLVAASQAPATFPGENGRLAVTRVRDADTLRFQVVTMNVDGTEEAVLTHVDDDDQGAAWSPDGRRIAAGDRGRIVTMNADGTCRTLVTDGGRLVDGVPAWSPDGQSIAFARSPVMTGGRAASIFVMGADGADQIDLAAGRLYGPRWSPDGGQIAFTSYGASGHIPYESDIHVMNADGSGKALIKPGGGGPVWSPDGRRIAFTGGRDGDSEVFVMNADGSGEARITHNAVREYVTSWQPRPTAPPLTCPPPPGPPATAPPPARDTAGPTMGISRRTVRATRRGIVSVRLRCPAGEAAGCSGRLWLRRRRATLGTAAFRVPANRTAAVRVRLSRAARRLLARRNRIRVTARVRAVDQAGNARIATARITVT